MQDYHHQLAAKCDLLLPQWQALDAPAPEVFASAPNAYRQRAEFRLWHEGDDAYYAMHREGSREIYRVDSFAPASPRISRAMPVLLAALNSNRELKHRLFAVEFLSTLSAELLVTLIYHRPIDESWDALAAPLEKQLDAHVIGRSRGKKRVLSRDYLTECLQIGESDWHYRQYEGSFSQPNAEVNLKMIEWAVDCAGQNPADLLELYCGNGNFTLPLSRCFRQVLATEVSKTSIRALNWNIEANKRQNLTCARLSAEELTQALNGVRAFRRLADIDLDSYRFSHLLVNPPRAGLDAATLAFAANFDQIIYISCNPQTLFRDLDSLCLTHKPVRTALFDQFPFTTHIESEVLLQRR